MVDFSTQTSESELESSDELDDAFFRFFFFLVFLLFFSFFDLKKNQT